MADLPRPVTPGPWTYDHGTEEVVIPGGKPTDADMEAVAALPDWIAAHDAHAADAQDWRARCVAARVERDALAARVAELERAVERVRELALRAREEGVFVNGSVILALLSAGGEANAPSPDITHHCTECERLSRRVAELEGVVEAVRRECGAHNRMPEGPPDRCCAQVFREGQADLARDLLALLPTEGDG